MLFKFSSASYSATEESANWKLVRILIKLSKSAKKERKKRKTFSKDLLQVDFSHQCQDISPPLFYIHACPSPCVCSGAPMLYCVSRSGQKKPDCKGNQDKVLQHRAGIQLWYILELIISRLCMGRDMKSYRLQMTE